MALRFDPESEKSSLTSNKGCHYIMKGNGWIGYWNLLFFFFKLNLLLWYLLFLDQYNELCYGGIALPFDLGLIFSNIEKESESVPTPDYEDSSCFKYLSTGKWTFYLFFSYQIIR